MAVGMAPSKLDSKLTLDSPIQLDLRGLVWSSSLFQRTKQVLVHILWSLSL